MSSPYLITTQTAIKEWSIAIEALLAGEMTVLLRKGGIRERPGDVERLFQLDRALLFPTVEHQKPELLKPDYADRVQSVPSGWHPETIELRAWAEFAMVLPVVSLEHALALSPLMIWNETFIRDRWHWKPERPLYALLLRTYRLAPSQTIPFTSRYRGCRSQVEVIPEIVLSNQEPVIDDLKFNRIAVDFQRLLRGHQC